MSSSHGNPKRVMIKISYDGTSYQGWQVQPHTDQTVQAQLQNAIKMIYQKDITVYGSGRTDSGVHAEAQTAHFDLPATANTDRIVSALNSQLPDDIAVQCAFGVPPLFHARHSAVGKTYKYRIRNRNSPDPLDRNFSHWVRRPLNTARLNEITAYVVGEHDFKSFQTSGSEVPDTVRTVSEAGWIETGLDEIQFKITGSGFLKQMVRNIVGTALDIELRGMSPGEMKSILEARNRAKALTTAPSKGLYLSQVIYPDIEMVQLDIQCRQP